jgi:carbon storage regulator
LEAPEFSAVRPTPGLFSFMEEPMLIVTRRKGESIDLEGCTVTVLRIKGGQVKLGIDAPEGVKILRSELLQTEENRNEKS